MAFTYVVRTAYTHAHITSEKYTVTKKYQKHHIVTTIYGLHLLVPQTEIGKLMFILICSSNPIESNWIESKCFPVHLLPIREIDYSFWLSAAADRIAPILITCGSLSLSYSFVRSFTLSLTFRFFPSSSSSSSSSCWILSILIQLLLLFFSLHFSLLRIYGLSLATSRYRIKYSSTSSLENG